MITDPEDRLDMVLSGREVAITISRGDEKRLRLYIDRHNAMCERMDCSAVMLDPDDDHDLAAAITCCLDVGLQDDEAEHGLESFPWGDIITAEQADEMRLRRAEGRD